MSAFSRPMIQVGKLRITYRKGGRDKHSIYWVLKEDFDTLQRLIDTFETLKQASETLPDKGAATLSQFSMPLSLCSYKILPGVFPQSPRRVRIVREHKLRFWEIEYAEFVEPQEVEKP